jgi:hypothetical protein
MDAKEFMQLHADNAVAQKMPEVMKDLTPEALQQVMPLMADGPNPPTKNQVVAKGQEGEHHVFDVTYSDDSGKSVSMREWVRQIDGVWKIEKLAKPS